MNKSYSISHIIIFIFLVVFVFFVAPLSLYSYKSFEQALNKNIENYLQQVSNITQALFEQEAFVLDIEAQEMSTLISSMDIDAVENMLSTTDTFTDDIDLLFVKTKNRVSNLSTSLFDTDLIIEHIVKLRYQENCVQNLIINNENLSILLKSKKIINKNSGKVEGEVYIGKILNENLTFLNNVVNKANIKELSLYLNKEIISTTYKANSSENGILKNIDELIVKNRVYEKGTSIFSKIPLTCKNRPTGVYIIPTIESKVFHSLKEDYNQQIFILLLFFFILGITAFFLMRKFIINPIYRLLDYAHDIKSSQKPYQQTVITEYNTLAKGLQSVINELRDVKEQYILAVEGTQEGLWDWNLKTKRIYFSKRCKEIIGYGEDEVSLVSIEEWNNRIHADDYGHVHQKFLDHIKHDADVFEDEFRILCKDGSYKWLKIKAKALFDESNRAYRMLGFYSDIDPLKQLEAQNQEKESYIIEQSKLSAMGDMLSNVAHQWRQPLSVITTVVSGIKVTLELGMFDKDDLVKDLNIINKTSQNLSKTIDLFKETQELEHTKEEFNLNEIILKDIQILEPAYTYKNISFVTQTKNIDYFGYKDEFLLVLNKIIQNAKDAIVIKNIEDGLIFINLYEEDESVILNIYDNAGGIEESIKDKIFEPYFTTKHKAQGVGLSLYVAKNILTKYFEAEVIAENKEYVYENEDYTGASFTVVFEKSKNNKE